MSKDAAEFVVQEYKVIFLTVFGVFEFSLKAMREKDAQGSARSAWRITVRQLESLVRLSEACARLHCLEIIEPKHVQEGARLLKKSIIRVEIPDINLGMDNNAPQVSHWIITGCKTCCLGS